MQKKSLILTLFLCLNISLFAQSGPELGDVNWDYYVDIVDALIIAQYYVLFDPVVFYPSAANVNCDSYIDIVDALLVAQFYVGVIDYLPCATPTPTPAPTLTPDPTSTPTQIPTATPTPVPTEMPGTGEVRLVPETTNVYSGESFITAIDINAGSHQYAHYEFGIFFDESMIIVDTSIGNNGVTIGTNGFISSVEISYGHIRIIGDRSSGIPSSGENLHVHWIAPPESGGSTRLDLLVYVLADENNITIGYPEGFPGYVNVTYTTPTPTPSPNPTPAPNETPAPTPVPGTTPDPTETPDGTDPPDDTPEPEPSPSDAPDPTSAPESTGAPSSTPEPEHMTVDVKLPSSSTWGGTYHWIPNTGDIFGPFKIKITVADLPPGSPLTNDSMFLDILPPLDDCFSSGESGNSNIRINRGTCQYVFYALYRNNKSPKILKIFKLKSGTVNNADRYKTVYSATGETVVIGKDGYVYHDYTGNIDSVQEMNFGIGIQEGTGTIRPGDDLRFRFGLLYYPEYYATATPGDFVAVYDKRMIDTAKQFCNNDAGISDWTRWNDGATVTDAVAYSWGCADSIEHFNADLEEQRIALSAYYSNGSNGNPYPANNEQLGENPDPSAHRNWSPWDQTNAPGSGTTRWHNYLWGEYDAEQETYIHLMINGTRYNPYMPGLSTWKKFSQDNYHSYDTKRSAGVDCAGFVQRCAGYEGNPYVSIDPGGRCIWGGGMPSLMDWRFGSDDYTWAIGDCNLLIPGDVLVGNNHIAMVLKIVYIENTRNINLNINGTTGNVIVIESTKGPRDQWKVMDSQTWTNLGTGYELRRLRINN